MPQGHEAASTGDGRAKAVRRPTLDCRYRAFISYSHADEAWARWLHKALETYRVPSRLVGTETSVGVIPRRLAPIFRDRDELASAHDLGERVNAALAESANLIVICSPRSATSRWVNEEVLAFKRLGRIERIFCLIVDGEPNASQIADRESEECFAPALRFTLDDGGELSQSHAEPVAADAREGKDGKRQAKLKLIAGLLDVGLDALKQREQQRRMRRMAAVTVLALIAMLVTTSLAITAVIARQQADNARRSAERRQKQAEGLVGFMLGDLNDKLQGVGRLDIMQAVDDKAMAYFQSLPTADVTDAALAGRATALQKIGGVRMDQGHLDEALAAFRLALKINRERSHNKPNDSENLTDYGGSLTWVGYALWYQGKLEGAKQDFKASLDALHKALELRPDSAEIQLQLAYAHNNLGQVLSKQGQLPLAREELTSQIAIFKHLIALDNENTEYRIGLGNAEGSLADLELIQGQLIRAINASIARQQSFSTLAARQPENRDFAQSLAISNAMLGQALHLVGDNARAMHAIGEAVRQTTTLVKFDPTNTYLKSLQAFYTVWQVRWLRESGSTLDTRSKLEAAQNTLMRLLDNDSGNVTRRVQYAIAQMEAAMLAVRHGHVDAARSQAQAVLQTLARQPPSQTKNLGASLVGCQAELLLARLASVDAPPAESTAAHLKRALDLSAPQSAQSSNPRQLAAWITTLLALDETAKALPGIHKLWLMGYRSPSFVYTLSERGIDYPPNPHFTRALAEVLDKNSASAIRSPSRSSTFRPTNTTPQ